MSEKENEVQEDNLDELFEQHSIVVDKKQSPERIDKFLMSRIQNATRSRLQNACKAGRVRVNGNAIKPNYKIRPLDEIKVYMVHEPTSGQGIKPEPIPLDIVYEDDYILVVNKQAGLVVHPGVGNWSGTLVNGLVHYFKSKELPVMAGNAEDRPGLVHRIDKDTSGLLVIAKTEDAISGLSKQFFDHTIDREYIALVWGDVEEEKGTIEGNIGRHPTMRTQMFVYDEEEGIGKEAITHYEVMENLYYVTLVKCKLETGRTHQIRVHMKYIGHTLFNDARYGGDKVLKGTVFTNYRRFVENTFEELPRQALHAASLGFEHPITKERMFFEAELPADFASALERWRGYTSTRKEIKNNES
ncbi:MAG: RluA family pseudouridine synthase [Saprospiraceae bacterium]|nr:RluA family pseudouridine synthase [Saprospiraceae bacterium]